MITELKSTPTQQPDYLPLSGTRLSLPQLQEYVDRVCMSSEFARSKRMVSMLRFLVDCYTAHEIEKLNERSIGIEIFNRENDWDPSTDTIVRSEVRRLRAKLKIYYETSGTTDPVRIGIPKGAYAPRIEWVAPSPQSAQFSPLSQPDSPLTLDNAGCEPGHRSKLSNEHIFFNTGSVRGRTGFYGSLAVVLMSLTVIFLRHTRKQITYRIVPFTSELGEEFSPAVSPDGTAVAYVARVDGNDSQILVKRLSQPAKEEQQVTKVRGVYLYPAWSPDGQTLAYIRVDENQVTVLARKLANDQERIVGTLAKESGKWSELPSPLLGDPGPEWMRDGKHMVVADHTSEHTGLSLMDEHGTKTPLTNTAGESRDYTPRVSPDGTTIAFIRYFSHGISDLFVVPVTGGVPRRMTFDQHELLGIAWERDGRSIIVSSDRDGSVGLWRIPLLHHWLSKELNSGTPTRLQIDSDAPTEPSISPLTGALFFDVSRQNWNIWRAPLVHGTLGKAEILLSSSGRNYDASYSPDGKRIAYISDRTGTMQLWLANADGSHPSQASNLSGSWMGGVAWSPDSRTIAFDARPRGHSAIFIADAATGKSHLLEVNEFEERMPSFSRDGHTLYLNSNRGGDVNIWSYDLDTHTYRRLPSQAVPGVFAAAESFDGQALIYGTRSGSLWRATPINAVPTPWNGLKAQPNLSWTAGPNGIYFTAYSESGVLALYHRSGTNSTRLGSITGTLVRNGTDVSISPDGYWVLLSKQEIPFGDIKLALPQPK